MKHIIIYHNKDLDGFCSGAIINEALKLRGVSPADIELMGYDYGGPFVIPTNCAVYMADVSLPMELMVEVAKHNVSFTWIDHHKTAIDSFNALSDWQKALFTTTVLDTTLSACELCWQWSYIGEMPEAVKLLGEYDTWRGFDSDRWRDEVYPFQFGLRGLVTSAETFPVGKFFSHINDALFGEWLHSSRMQPFLFTPNPVSLSLSN